MPILASPAAAAKPVQTARAVVVIVNYRTPGLVIDCLRSLEPEVTRPGAPGGQRGLRVIIADNCSGDDSLPRLANAIEQYGWNWAELLPLTSNGGFAYGNNQAIRRALSDAEARPDYVLLLNPDTVVRPGAIDRLIAFLDAHPDVGLAGSRLEDPDGTVQRSAFRFHSVFSEIEEGLRLGFVSRILSHRRVAPEAPEQACPTDWVAGASLIVRRQVLEQVGLMDEEYFMYFEEVDFCLRARQRGWTCWYVPESRVMHLVGQASGVTDRARQRRRRPAYWFESRRRFFIRNHGRAYAAAADAAFIVCYALWRLRRHVQRKPESDPERFLGDFVRHSVFCRGFGT